MRRGFRTEETYQNVIQSRDLYDEIIDDSPAHDEARTLVEKGDIRSTMKYISI
jgi:hypothetical protein